MVSEGVSKVNPAECIKKESDIAAGLFQIQNWKSELGFSNAGDLAVFAVHFDVLADELVSAISTL